MSPNHPTALERERAAAVRWRAHVGVFLNRLVLKIYRKQKRGVAAPAELAKNREDGMSRNRRRNKLMHQTRNEMAAHLYRGNYNPNR